MRSSYCLFLFLVTFTVKAQLSPTKVTDYITVSLPSDFRPMNEQEINSKYVYTRRPMALYTDYGVTVDFGINRGNNQWAQGDLNILKDFYKANISSLYDEVSFTKDAIETINGREFAVFEFVAIVKPEEDAITNESALRTYSYIQYTIVNNQTLVFTLSSPYQHMRKWKDLAPQIMQSVSIKKNFK
ncbi:MULTISPECIES: hypothetical protein [unclassified Imperialibacter]|uniref:hypothetical protein n=1 Tax=unclassified Imperialibacter TaxID=2629706 RepID=UPI00125465CF|nr:MULTISPECIES: hypothetical protein [unclassified Imperialibacter]CAD5274546.1 conserved exported hypothetical protein [Imperialibacter sp. 75]CAD5288225.1 conserved exported hypothetical protein [Imperialibacter sp. 89]VVT35598.1 conserved exported hypothetical protein [Imperialibacter sp. EC-SDR9]